MPLNIVIALGSVRPGRMVDRVAKLVIKKVETHGLKPVILDPLETCKYELVKQPLHFLPDAKDAPAWMKVTHAIIQAADGFLVLCPEYNCGISPVIPNLFNSFPPASYRHKPCGIVTYSMGTFGGVRAQTLLRPYLSELGLVTIPIYGPIPNVHTLIDEGGDTKDEMVTQRIEQVVQEIMWYSLAMKSFKVSNPPPT